MVKGFLSYPKPKISKSDMMYKVTYYTLALMDDGTNGNIKQETGQIAYMQAPIEKIPDILDDHLSSKKRTPVITNIEKKSGECIVYD